MSGNYIKIDRKILKWEWYGNINTKVVFLHCLLMANWKDGKFEGKEIKRGSFVTSLVKMSEETGLTVRQVRVALDHLVLTGELTIKTTNKYRIITVNNYSDYQDIDNQIDSQMTNKRQTNDKQMTNKRQTNDKQMTTIEEKKEKKEGKEGKNENIYITESNDSVCRTDIQRILDAWNSIGSGVNAVKKLSNSSKRYQMLNARIKEYGIEEVLAAIEKVRGSPFLKGDNSRNWIIDFEWFVKPNNFPKVLEGKYDDRRSFARENERADVIKRMEDWVNGKE